MPSFLERDNKDFFNSASKRLGWKSKRLDAVIAALTAYQNGPTEERLRTLYKSVLTWKRLDPSETQANHRGSNIVKLLSEIRGAARTRSWQIDSAHPAEPSPINLIAGVKEELDKCKAFACTDVGTFAGDINGALPKERRDEIYALGTSKGRSTGKPLIPNHELEAGDWDPQSLRETYDQVYGNLAGECTSFAKAAAHLLSTVKVTPFMPRIEIVSFRNQRQVPRVNRDGSPMFKRGADGQLTDQQAMERQFVTHVFCVVGRRGTTYGHGNSMPACSTWNAETRIVDCWLAALGYRSSFTVSGYPKQGYLAQLHLEMDSYKGKNAVFW